MYNTYLYHYGIKGQKWGVRRYQNPDGTLTDTGIKRYATKGYSKDAYDANKSSVGKAYDKITGANKYTGKMQYDMSSKEQNKARAEKYLADEKIAKKKAKKKINIGKKKVVTTLSKIGKVASTVVTASVIDDMFYNGAGKRTVKYAGRAAVTAALTAMGHRDIRWYY